MTQNLDATKLTGKLMFREPLNGELTEWVASAYQYAYTSVDNVEEQCNPAFIIYAECDEDIFIAIEYAIENDLAIAVRSGGHQYNAASSTANNNLQIDLSGKLASSTSEIPYTKASLEKVGDDLILKVGCGVALAEISKLMIENGAFFPRGECATVHFGGHSNTGGMSPITANFGAMIDHIIEFDFICSKYPRNKKTIFRPDLWNKDKENALSKIENDELFWAVLGGSPGNFGILTAAKIKCLKDEDYPQSRGLKLAWPYAKETVEKIAQIVCSVSDNKELSASLSISAVVVGPEYFYPDRNPSAPLESKGNLTLDDEMLQKYPQLAGLNKFNYIGEGHGMIAVYGAFLNPTGAEVFENQLKAFEEVRDQFLKIPGCAPAKDFPLIREIIRDVFDIGEFIEGKIFGHHHKAKEIEEFHKTMSLNCMMYGDKHIPLSQVLNNLSWDNPREFSLSYKKLSYIGNSRLMAVENQKLSSLPVMQGLQSQELLFSTWLSRELENVLSRPREFHGMYFAVQFGVIGGPGLVDPSKFGGKAEYTSLAHRNSNFWFDFDVFYNPEIEGCTDATTKYINSVAKLVVNNTLNLFKDGMQQRVLLGPAFPLGEQAILDKYWEFFYDDNVQYNRLCELKNKYDQKQVFTANLMCIGATRVDRMQGMLKTLLKREYDAKEAI